MLIYFPFLFALMALFFLFIGVKVVLSKRPILISSRYFFALMVLGILPLIIYHAFMLYTDSLSNVGLTVYLIPIMFFCLLVFMWFQMKGYMAIGVTGGSFREALHYSLNKNSLPFEEQLSVIKLTSINASLQVAIQSWIGAGQIKLKNTTDLKLLSKIVAGINEYYIENNIRPNNITSIFYIVFGILTLLLAGVSFYNYS